MSDGDISCPFCEELLSGTVVVCRGCGAEQGWLYANGGVCSRGQVFWRLFRWGLVAAGATRFVVWLWSLVQYDTARIDEWLALWGIVMLPFLAVIIPAIRALCIGPRWFRTTRA